jgi:arsenate reductase (glutaredoxin)
MKSSSSLIIYHNPRCRKSREGLKYLIDNKIEHSIVDYMNTNLTVRQLKEILLKLNKKASEIVRNQEGIYKKELKGRKFEEEEWIKIIISEPRLLIRPIVVAKHKAVIAIPPEKIAGLL